MAKDGAAPRALRRGEEGEDEKDEGAGEEKATSGVGESGGGLGFEPLGHHFRGRVTERVRDSVPGL